MTDKPQMHLYAGYFDKVCIEIMGRDEEDAKKALIDWVNKATTSYELKDFKLIKLDGWKDDGL
jgi:hypothetical protein